MHEKKARMPKDRLVAFTDGVIAVIITIMVLELKVPHGVDFASLRPLYPVFLSYVLSFVYVGIYWNNHHHMFQAAEFVSGRILWLNLHLLFWLSLIPFATGWMGEDITAPVPVAAYGFVLLFCGIAYTILAIALVVHHGADSLVSKTGGTKLKGMLSISLYVTAIALAFVDPWISGVLYVAVALAWFIPERQIERALAD
jgi:uncharacterized membrane protein